MLEETVDDVDDLPLKDIKDSKSAGKMKASATSTTKSSVADRVKALEKSKLSKKSEDKDKDKEKQLAEEQPPPPLPAEPPIELNSAKNKPGISSKLKSSATITKPSKAKDLYTASASDKKSSKDKVPGSFPDDQADLMDLNDSPVIERKSAAKAKVSKTKSPKDRQTDIMDDALIDVPVAKGPPTPPPESKPKKERARIVKDDTTSSWGLWGTAPKRSATVKKPTKATKDDADVVSPTREKASLARSKSTRTAKEKEKEESRSSGASEKEKRPSSRPSQPRQSTFGSFFGSTPSPASRPKSAKRPSTMGRSSSRRQSTVDAANSGIPSPPPEDDVRGAPDMNDKAAKLMGVGGKDKRKKRSGNQPQARSVYVNANTLQGVPDPYAIDDDDLVMVNPIEDPIINAPIPKKDKRDKPSRSRSKPEVRKPFGLRRSVSQHARPKANLLKPKILSDPDDIVMVDGPSPTGLDDDTSFERPSVQRSNTSARKSGFMGLFGLRKPEPEPSRAISGDEAYGGSRRKRLAVDPDEGSKRPRRTHRSERVVDDAEGIIVDAPLAGDNIEVEDPEARREARRARKEDKERQARKSELRELEERRARRELKSKGATEDRKSRIREAMNKGGSAEVVEDLDFMDGEETEKPRRHRSTRETDEDRRARHRSSRKSSHIDGPLPTRTIVEEDERRSHKDGKSSGKRDTKDRQKPEPVEDYFDSRNSKSSSKGNPYAHNTAKGVDKTSSWVNSQVLDPPGVPPIEGTVLEQDPVLGPDDGERDLDETPVDEEEERRRRKRTERRRSRADRVLGEEEASRRRRTAENGDGAQRSSEGSEEKDYERERRRRAGSTGYGKPPMDKRTSWFKKLGI